MAASPYRVLVVDDEAAVCAFVQDELCQQGCDCAVATDPQQAIALLDGDAFDLNPCPHFHASIERRIPGKAGQTPLILLAVQDATGGPPAGDAGGIGKEISE